MRITINNTFTKNKHKYFGLNSKLVEKIIENNEDIEVYNPVNRKIKTFEAEYFEKCDKETLDLENKFNFNNKYAIQYFKLY